MDEQLTIEQAIDLHIHIKMSSSGKFYEPGKALPPTDILAIASLLITNKNISQVARETGRSRHSVRRVLKLLENERNLFLIPTKPKGSGEHTAENRLDFLLDLIIKYPVSDLQTIKVAYDAAFLCDIHISMMHYILTQHLNFVWKRTEIVEYAQTRPAIKRLRERFETTPIFPFHLL